MAPPFPPDDDRLRAVRDALPAVGAGIYLDTATAGPLPSESAAAMAELASWEVRTGRASAAFLEETGARLEEARAAVAAVLTADVDEVAMAVSAAAAIASACASIPWRAGDSVVTVGLEHAPALEPAGRIAAALGLGTRVVPLDPEASAVERAIDASTRLVALPHVSAATGQVVPVSRVAEAAHRRSAFVAVEGTQAAGAVPVDVPSLGVDFYAVEGDAWLLGPSGVGAMWVARPPARRLDGSGWYRPAVVGLARSVGWISMYVGLGWLQDRARALSAALCDRLASVAGVELVTPADRMATIVTFRIAGWPAAEALDELGARVFLLARAVLELDAIRLSVAGFNSAAELERLLDAVELLAAHRPGTLPARRSLAILGQDPA